MATWIKQTFQTNHAELNSIAVLHNKHIWRHFGKVTVGMIFIPKEVSGKFSKPFKNKRDNICVHRTLVMGLENKKDNLFPCILFMSLENKRDNLFPLLVHEL